MHKHIHFFEYAYTVYKHAVYVFIYSTKPGSVVILMTPPALSKVTRVQTSQHRRPIRNQEARAQRPQVAATYIKGQGLHQCLGPMARPN